MDLSQKKMLIGMLLTGTVMGGAGVVGMNVLPPALFPLPDGAEVIDPLSGVPWRRLPKTWTARPS